MKYDDLIEKVNADSDIKIGRSYLGLSMKEHPQPVSITEREFNFITDFIIKHNLKKGYEVATAFGVSSLAAGLGFKETGGQLVTMDSYVEEVYNDCDAYRHNPIDNHLNHFFMGHKLHKTPDGFALCDNIFKIFGLEKIIQSCIGMSPVDIKGCLALGTIFDRHNTCKDLSNAGLDYAFIDAEHNDLALLTDISAITPFLDYHRYAIFIHDKHCFGPQLDKLTKRIFNNKFEVVFPDGALENHYNLAVITKNL